jgi:putative membrane protein
MIRNFLISIVAVGIVFYILPSTSIMSTSITGIPLLDKSISLLIVSIILAALNMTVKPIIKIISLPINIVTLGLFSIIINAVIILIADKISNAFEITGFVNYIIFGILLSLVNIGLSVFKDND